MCTEVDVFITNYTLVDPDIYQLWIQGYSASEAVSILNQKGLGKITGAPLELIASDVLDHYRTYSLLEKLLNNPTKLQEQLLFQIEPRTRQLLIEKYYEFDDSVIRELLGKKLTSKNRKDLDEVSEKTSIPLKSCRRQFDNVKRIHKIVEEMSGSLAQNIHKTFSLSEELSKKYATIVFLACLRFETAKKKLQHLTFATLKQSTELILRKWTYNCTGPEYFDTEMDKEFLLDLRELRVVMDKDKEHKLLVCSRLKSILSPKSYAEVDSNFRTYTRAVITLAISIHRVRELRNLFLELVQILDLWKSNNWILKDLEQFFNIYTQCALEMDVIRDAVIKQAWERFMAVINKCLLIIYIN